MHKLLGLLGVFAVLGTAATAGWATPPGKNGDIVFRRYLDAERTTGAIFTIRADGKRTRQVTHPPRGVIDQYPDWSPDGRRIVFHRMVPCPPEGPKNGIDRTCDLIYTIGRDGRGLAPLVPCSFDASKAAPESCVGAHTPAWSPDGGQVAFSYSIVNRQHTASLSVNRAIWIANADGTARRQVTSLAPGPFWDDEPQWSPDGTRLVFTRVDLQRKADAVFVVDIDGTGQRQLTPWTLNAAGDPEWSPDGRWIVFIGHPADGSENVYRVRPDGSSLTNLSRQRASGYHYLSSSYSPDGKLVVSARTPGAGKNRHADLVVMNPDGTNVRQITKTTLWESSVDWGARVGR